MFYRIKKYASVIYMPPFSKSTYTNWPKFLEKANFFSLIMRRLTIDIILYLSKQGALEHAGIRSNDRKILWVNIDKAFLGDSLDDLSSRVLFDKRYTIHLFAPSHIGEIFNGDPFFKKIISEVSDLDEDYDLIILQKYSWRSFKIKIKLFKKTPYFSIHKYFSGVEFNRLLHSFYSISTLLGKYENLKSTEIKTYFNLKYSHNTFNEHSNQIVIAIGGIDPTRTYNKWDELIRKILKSHPTFKIVLVGNENGLEESKRINNAFNNGRIVNLVGKNSIFETFDVLKKSKIIVCADGGLMHMAQAVNLPAIALFSDDIHPLMRFSESYKATAIHAKKNVSDISSSLITDELVRAINTPLINLRLIFLNEEPVCV